MRISSIQQIKANNSSNNNNKFLSKPNYMSKMSNDSVSFGSNYLIFLAAKNGINAISGGFNAIQMKELTNELSQVIMFPKSKSQAELTGALRALSKIPDGADEGFFNWLVSTRDRRYICELRKLAVSDESSFIPSHLNSSDDSIQAKKEFFTSFISNGLYLHPDFMRRFHGLDDMHFGAYKYEFIDSVFHSRPYESKFLNKYKYDGYGSPEGHYFEADLMDMKLKLINGLPKDRHPYYWQKKQAYVNSLQSSLGEAFEAKERKILELQQDASDWDDARASARG